MLTYTLDLVQEHLVWPHIIFAGLQLQLLNGGLHSKGLMLVHLVQPLLLLLTMFLSPNMDFLVFPFVTWLGFVLICLWHNVGRTFTARSQFVADVASRNMKEAQLVCSTLKASREVCTPRPPPVGPTPPPSLLCRGTMGPPFPTHDPWHCSPVVWDSSGNAHNLLPQPQTGCPDQPTSSPPPHFDREGRGGGGRALL